ncbi:hypothetical protein Tco_0477672 [Tanacetum coccineum]
MTRCLLQKLSRAEEETRVRSLPIDQPLNRYGLHVSSESNTRISNILKARLEKKYGKMMRGKNSSTNLRAI